MRCDGCAWLRLEDLSTSQRPTARLHVARVHVRNSASRFWRARLAALDRAPLSAAAQRRCAYVPRTTRWPLLQLPACRADVERGILTSWDPLASWVRVRTSAPRRHARVRGHGVDAPRDDVDAARARQRALANTSLALRRRARGRCANRQSASELRRRRRFWRARARRQRVCRAAACHAHSCAPTRRPRRRRRRGRNRCGAPAPQPSRCAARGADDRARRGG